MAWGCFSLFRVRGAITSPSFVSPRLLVFEIYYLRLFINNYIVYYDVYCYYCGVFIEKYVYAKFRCVSEIHSHLCPYIEMCGLRVFIVVLQELHCLPYMFVWSELEVAITSPSFVALHFLVSVIAKCIAWGCLLFIYKKYIGLLLIIVVHSLKSICIPSFVLIGSCVSELHAQLCPYHNVRPELHCLQKL